MNYNISKEWIVYNNIIGENGFFHYRNVEHDGKILSREEFNETLRRNKFIYIHSKVNNKFLSDEYDHLHIKPIHIILLSSLNTNITKSAYLVGLVNKLNAMLIKQKKTKDYEVIFINRNNPKKNVIVSLKKYKWYMYSYTRFAIKFPLCTQYAKHTILNKKETDKLLERLSYKNKSVLPKITKDDTAIIWIGAKPGDVIQVERHSENTLFTIDYRIVSNLSLERK